MTTAPAPEGSSGLIIRPVGREALLVEVADLSAARALYAAVRSLVSENVVPLPRDVVPAARTVLIDGVQGVDEWRARIGALDLTDRIESTDEHSGGIDHVVPVHYDGEDLDVVAAAWSCSASDVVRRHQGTTFTVAFCGFAPGFAYCTPVTTSSETPWPEVPRRVEPRSRVPAGAVALAGPYCGVYPREMPGGWQLVGRTDAVIFDPDRDSPALLAPGDRVRFEAAR